MIPNFMKIRLTQSFKKIKYNAEDLYILSLHPLETANILISQLILLSFWKISHKPKIPLNTSGIHDSCPHSDGQNGAG